MKITPTRCTCSKCEHVFEAEMITDAPIGVFAAALKAIRCPACASDKIGLGGGYKDVPPLTVSVEERAAWWLERGERGISSNTIFSAFSGGKEFGSWGASGPRDPDDYRRCRLLLDLIPEWRANLAAVSNRFPWLAPFAEAWDEFDRLWEVEHKGLTAPKLYAAIQSASKASNALQRKRA